MMHTQPPHFADVLRFPRSATRVVQLFCLISTLACAHAAAGATPGLLSFDFSPPRNIGYALGDVIDQQITIVLESAYHLDQSKLAKPGRINSWLELKSARINHHRGIATRTYRIDLAYQLFNTTPKVHGLATPAQTFTINAPNGSYPLVLAPWSFSAVPVVNPMQSAHELPSAMQHAREPLPLPSEMRSYRMWLSALIATLAFAGWWWLRFGHARKHRTRPFALAYKEIARLEDTIDNQRRAMRSFHEALNATQGRTVFASHIEEFLSEHPKFRPLRERLEHFFAVSRQTFFGPHNRNDYTPLALHDLKTLCREARAAERR